MFDGFVVAQYPMRNNKFMRRLDWCSIEVRIILDSGLLIESKVV